jgi:hypothetical protein
LLKREWAYKALEVITEEQQQQQKEETAQLFVTLKVTVCLCVVKGRQRNSGDSSCNDEEGGFGAVTSHSPSFPVSSFLLQ